MSQEITNNEAYIINKDTDERKELDVNEYNKQRIS